MASLRIDANGPNTCVALGVRTFETEYLSLLRRIPNSDLADGVSPGYESTTGAVCQGVHTARDAAYWQRARFLAGFGIPHLDEKVTARRDEPLAVGRIGVIPYCPTVAVQREQPALLLNVPHMHIAFLPGRGKALSVRAEA